MKISKNLTLGEFAAFVASQLKSRDIETELTGGAVVSIYTNNKYQSNDADFISPAGHQKITQAMLEVGFEKKGRDFRHPNTDFFVEFPSGPLAIGNQRVKAESELQLKGNNLNFYLPRNVSWIDWPPISTGMTCKVWTKPFGWHKITRKK